MPSFIRGAAEGRHPRGMGATRFVAVHLVVSAIAFLTFLGTRLLYHNCNFWSRHAGSKRKRSSFLERNPKTRPFQTALDSDIDRANPECQLNPFSVSAACNNTPPRSALLGTEYEGVYFRRALLDTIPKIGTLLAILHFQTEAHRLPSCLCPNPVPSVNTPGYHSSIAFGISRMDHLRRACLPRPFISDTWLA